MKIPLIWLKDYLDTDKPARQLAKSFTQLGLMLDKPLGSDNVLDLEHRMDRADWLSVIGCARDLAAFEEVQLKLPKGYNKPGHAPSTIDQIPVTVKTPAVRRFQTRVFRGIKVGPSPKWLVDRLTAYGMESINNVVDITNFVMVEYGQPMHAQDLAKLKTREITIRPAKKGEKVTTLLGTEVELDPETFVLSSGGEVTVIGGIVGGKNTGVTNSTTNIILDAGNYDSRVVRKNSRRLKIINESVSRYDKFLDPRLIDVAISRATALILELAGGEYFENDDYYPSPVVPQTLKLRLSRLKLISGMEIKLARVKKILKDLGYIVVEEGEGELVLEVPYYRTDIEVEDDLVSDILRINNYSSIPTQALSTAIPKDITLPITLFEEKLKNILLAQGAHEHITTSLATFNDESGQIELVNALTQDQNALRTSLVGGLTKVASAYRKHKMPYIAVFEIGKVFSKKKDSFLEESVVTVLFENKSKVGDSLATLLSGLGISSYQVTNSLDITVDGKTIGRVAKDSYTLITNKLLEVVKDYTGIISEYARSNSLDLSLIAGKDISYADIIAVINDLTGTWESVHCKSVTKFKSNNNYLLSVTWASDNQKIEAEKNAILKALKEKLKITSKS